MCPKKTYQIKISSPSTPRHWHLTWTMKPYNTAAVVSLFSTSPISCVLVWKNEQQCSVKRGLCAMLCVKISSMETPVSGPPNVRFSATRYTSFGTSLLTRGGGSGWLGSWSPSSCAHSIWGVVSGCLNFGFPLLCFQACFLLFV